MKQKSRFENDFEKAMPYFPKLTFMEDKKGGWTIRGELDICDQGGNYWETFKINIEIQSSYPFCVPKVREVSNIIDREDDWHIDKRGYCCLDIDHKLLIKSKRGIDLTDYIRNVICPYFANQLYKKEKGNYAASSYLHGFDGVRQYYAGLGIVEVDLAIKIIKGVLHNKLPSRNDPCFCGKAKFKNCHLLSVNKLKSVSKEQLKIDLENFKKIN